MLVRLTFVKRFTKDGITFMSHRVYDVDESHAQTLCNVTVNDMPVFKVVLPGQVKPKEQIIDMTSSTVAARVAEEAEDAPEESIEEMEARMKAEAAANKKALAAKKAAAKTAPAKAATKLSVKKEPAADTNVDMVE